MNLIQLGLGLVQRILPSFNRESRRVISRELSKQPAVPDIPPNPPKGRRSYPFANYWDHLGNTLGAGLVADNEIGIDQYRQMVEEDETVSAAIDFITLTVMQQFGTYVNKNRRAAKYVEEMWARCQTSLAEYLREALSALWAGFSVGERVFAYEDGKLWLDQLPVLDPSGLVFLMDTERGSRRFGMVSGVNYIGNVLAEPIGIESLSIFTHNGLFGDPRGRSRCRSMFPNWISKKALFLQWSKTLESYGTPTSYAKSKGLQNPEKHWITGKASTRAINILDMLKNMHDQGTAALPEDVDLMLIQAKNALGEDFERAQNHFNKCILRGLLIPALLFEPTDIGSFALGDKHFEIFMASVRNVAESLNRVVMRTIIEPLIRWNLGKNTPVGEFKIQRIQGAELKLWSEIFYSMADKGFIREDQLEDANIVREKFGFPLWVKLPPLRLLPTPGGNGGGENLPGGKAPDGRGGTDPGHPSATPQAPSKPQGRPGKSAPKKKAA